MIYRKYRPKTFKELTGQKHIVQTLQGALLSDNVGHAYLFTGARGTGKTTTARLLAKTVNCEKRTPTQVEPCDNCSSCNAISLGNAMDLIEIDAASNRGIDEIRNIKESAQVAASSSRYKVFIIDEVHMLTTAAFNALLKTLEEPPSHIIFILATTEVHKVLDTILSRVQRFDFKKISREDIVDKLRRVAKNEKLSIDTPSLDMVAQYANGSLRDAESALTKLIAYAGNDIKENTVSEILGIVPNKVHESLLELIKKRDAKSAIDEITTIHESGVNLEHFAKQFIQYVRNLLVSTLEGSPRENTTELVKIITRFTQAMSDLKYSPIPSLPLELAIVDLTSPDA